MRLAGGGEMGVASYESHAFLAGGKWDGNRFVWKLCTLKQGEK